MYQPQNAPSIQLEGDALIVRLDHGGLVIIRKNAEPYDPQSISLPPDEASEFTMLLMMSQHAIAPLVQSTHHVFAFGANPFEQFDEGGENDEP